MSNGQKLRVITTYFLDQKCDPTIFRILHYSQILSLLLGRFGNSLSAHSKTVMNSLLPLDELSGSAMQKPILLGVNAVLELVVNGHAVVSLSPGRCSNLGMQVRLPLKAVDHGFQHLCAWLEAKLVHQSLFYCAHVSPSLIALLLSDVIEFLNQYLALRSGLKGLIDQVAVALQHRLQLLDCLGQHRLLICEVFTWHPMKT